MVSGPKKHPAFFKKINPPADGGRVSLPDEDSNLDKQNQNLSYYLYTIGQS
jgi:hypothetical protein